MSSSPRPARRSPLYQSHFAWTWLAVVFSVGICAALSWLHYEQSKSMFEADRIIDGISQARIDLSKGFLYVALAGDPQTPFRAREGQALIDQAIASLKQTGRTGVGGLPVPLHEGYSWSDFESKAAAFRLDLAAWIKSKGNDRNMMGLRMHLAFHDLEQYASQIDLASEARLDELNLALSRTFTVAISLSAGLLCAICAGAYVSGRKQQRAVKAMLQSEKQLRHVGDHLPDGYIYRFERKPDGTPVFSYISAGVKRVHGISAEECLQDATRLMSLTDPAQKDAYAAAEAASARHLTDFEMDLRFRHPEGGYRIVHVRSKPARDEAGMVFWDGLVVDVTERRRVEEIIHKNEALLQDMGNVAKVGGWEFDVATGEGEWTEEVARIHDLEPGVKPSKELGLTFYSESSRKKLEAALKAAVEKGLPYDLELEFVSAKKVPKWIHTIGRPIYENGRVVRLRGSFQDITRLKLAELALREREHQLSLFVEHSPAAIAMLDASMRYLAVSRRWLTDYHLEEKNVLGHSHYEVFPEVPDRWREIHRRCLAGATEKCEADAFPRADGSVDWVRWEILPWRRDDAGIGGLIIFSEVITRQKEAEAAIRRKQQNYEEIFNASNDALVWHDAASGQVLDVNAGVLRMFGYASKAEYFAKDGFHLMMTEAPYDLNEARRRMQLAVEQGPQIFEWQVQRRNGERFWVEVSLRSSQIDGQGRVLAVVRDISQRKAHEFEIERLNRLYSTLSQVNQIIVRCQSRDELFREIARVMIEFGQLRAVWIGLKTPDGILEEVCRRTSDPANPEQPLTESEGACGVLAEMLQTGAPVFCHDTLTDARTACCRKRLPQTGIKSCAAFPLRFHGQLAGAFSISSVEPNFFNPEEVRLLDEIAGDISFAMDRLDEQGQRNRAEALLRQSEEQFRIMFETAAIGMAQASLSDGRLLRVNRELCKITGYSEPELLQRRISEITHPEDRAANWEAFQRVARGEAADYHLEKRYIHKDGSIAWVNVHMTVIRDAAGRPIRAMSTIENITERKQSEIERTRLTTAMEQAAELILITDLQGNIVYVNPAFEKVTGYSRAEVIGKNPRLLKSGTHDHEYYKAMWDALLHGSVWNGRLTNKKKDGTLFEEDVTISPVRNDKGKIVNFVALKRDVTREVELETQVRQAQKMEGIGQLAGGVAHDFNNILAAIMMQAQLVETTEGIADKIAEDMVQIRQACERGANLTRQLLLFSRKQTIQTRSLNLNEIVTNIAKMLQRIIGESVLIQLNLHPKPLMTHADAGMLDQVLLNLAVNGRDAMNAHGQLTIKTSEAVVNEEAHSYNPDAGPGNYVCLSVSDTGSGIAPEVLPRIFEPFFTTKEQGKGTGLGLATVFGIVKQHKGWVQVKTDPGKGSTFDVYLPAIVAPPKPKDGESNQVRRLKGTETILLAEDDFSVRKITRKFLELHGYTVLEAADGEEAFKLWKENRSRVDLLLTDLLMPKGINGRDLARQMRQEEPGLKVIYFSGYSADLVGRGLELRLGENFLQKPVTPQQLLELIRRQLGDKRAS